MKSITGPIATILKRLCDDLISDRHKRRRYVREAGIPHAEKGGSDCTILQDLLTFKNACDTHHRKTQLSEETSSTGVKRTDGTGRRHWGYDSDQAKFQLCKIYAGRYWRALTAETRRLLPIFGDSAKFSLPFCITGNSDSHNDRTYREKIRYSSHDEHTLTANVSDIKTFLLSS